MADRLGGQGMLVENTEDGKSVRGEDFSIVSADHLLDWIYELTCLGRRMPGAEVSQRF